jgi:NSS family neurotransmitter:Na+ symporter
MRSLTQQHHRRPAWTVIGWMGVVAGFLILSYYSVIAGWAVSYIVRMASGTFTGASAEEAAAVLSSFQADPLAMLLWHTLFMALTVYIVGKGVTRGLELAIRWFMPLLFLLLCVLLVYAINSGGFAQGWNFMFRFDWELVTGEALLIAMGQAFFTLSIGIGAIMAYGAYVPSSASITQSVVTIAALDTLVAVAAGVAIFPIVFANGLEPGQGPGLMFVTIPLAFGQLPFGAVFGTVFFLLVSFAAITSAISLTEPVLAYLVEEYNAKRARVAVSVGVICWLLGIGTVLSFNAWSDVKILGDMDFFTTVDHISQNLMLPIGGLLIGLFVAWALPKAVVKSQLGLRANSAWLVWKVLIGVVAPLGVLVVFIVNVAGMDAVKSWFGG